MSLLDRLSPASYKGTTFLVVSGRVAGGRKDVKHSYPNKDTQVIEDMGLAPRTYNLEIVITGDNYTQDRDQLLAVLSEGGTGPLVHPFYGRVENIAARSWVVNENMTALGDGRLSVVFEPSEDTGIPQARTNTLNNVATKNTALQEATQADIAEGFDVTESFTGNFGSAVDLVNDVLDTFIDSTSFLQAAADQIDGFTQQIADVSGKVFSLVKAPTALADSIRNLFISVDNLYPTVEATASVLTGFFNFKDDREGYPITTAGRAERANNEQVIASAVQTMALGFTYLNAVQIDYNTTVEIESASDTLEIQYEKIVQAGGLSDTSYSALIDLRLAAQDYFEQQKITARRVVSVHAYLTSARLLSFTYYGSSQDGDALVKLNDAEDVAFMEGTVEVLTA